jgi:hypothetical protein
MPEAQSPHTFALTLHHCPRQCTKMTDLNSYVDGVITLCCVHRRVIPHGSIHQSIAIV